MTPDPLLGVFLHWLGGLSSASFYVPYKRIRGWSWEIFWITGGLFSWLFAPWLFAAIQTPHLLDLLGSTDSGTLFWCWFWGVMWGLGGLTFGLTMRYLGLSLGMAVVLGLTTVIGTVGPPLFHGLIRELAATASGRITFIGIGITLVGIVLVAMAGRAKEREGARRNGSSGAAASSGVAEFDLRRGLLIAVFSGFMSGCFAWGLAAGQPIRSAAVAAGMSPLWQGLPVLCVVLAGGLTTNLIWCAVLIRRNRSLGELAGRVSAGAQGDGAATQRDGAATQRDGAAQGAGSAAQEAGAAAQGIGAAAGPGAAGASATRTPLARNYLLAALGGTLWYFQFFFYTMGESQMGRYGFSSWTLHMASIILFSTLWGFALQEWAGASGRTRALVWSGIAFLVGSTVVIGVGNYLSMPK